MNKVRDAGEMPTSLPAMGPQVTTPTGGIGGSLGSIGGKSCDEVPISAMAGESGRLQKPVTMGAATETAPSGLTSGIRTGQTQPPGPSP